MTASFEIVEDAKPRPKRWQARVGVVAFVAYVVAMGIAGGLRDEGTASAAPAFDLPALEEEGSRVVLADARGQPLVLNFWASWCVPCRQEMPEFQRLSEELKGRVTFLGINHKDSRTEALEFAQETGVTYELAYDPEGDVAGAYGVFGMPTTVLITPDGRVAATKAGELSGAELARLIERHLGVGRNEQ